MKTSLMLFKAVLENPNDIEPRRCLADALIEEGRVAYGELLWKDIENSNEVTMKSGSLEGKFGQLTTKNGFPFHIKIGVHTFMLSAKALFLTYPITSVEIVGRTPDCISEEVEISMIEANIATNTMKAHWGNEELAPRHLHLHCLPKDVFILLAGSYIPTPWFGSWNYWASYDSVAKSLNAASKALVKYGRKMAELSELRDEDYQNRWIPDK